MISTVMIYIILFINFLILSLSIYHLRKIRDAQQISEDDAGRSFNLIVDEIRKLQGQTRTGILRSKDEIIQEIKDMRAEWDMETLKTSILQRSRGNSRNWEKWHKTFGGKTKGGQEE